ncbi:MAG: OB-fold nucleic acid binding domain-containing protein [Anaerolineales bacterium]
MVRVAGLVTHIRPHQTKAGKPMGFVTLEDIQGTIELVMFPRIWEQQSEILDFDKILLFEGRLDSSGREAKVLVNRIYSDLGEVKPLPAMPLPKQPVNSRLIEAAPQAPAPEEEEPRITEERNQEGDGRELLSISEIEDETSGVKDDDIDELENGPPPPDNFPASSGITGAVIAAVTEPEVSKALAEAGHPTELPENEPLPEEAQDERDQASSTVSGGTQAALTVPLEQPIEIKKKPAPEGELPPYIIAPLTPLPGEQVHMITIVLRSTGDKLRDNLRIRQIYGTLITYPGNDRFAFQVYEHGRGYLVEFPNFTTGMCPDLLNRLKEFVQVEHIKVEPLTFQ